MRFVISGEWTKNSLLRLIMLFFLLYVLFFWVTNFLLFYVKMNPFDPQSVIEYYRGSAERYLQPRSYQGLLEISHFHLFAMGILILTLTHLLLFAPISYNLKAYLIIATFSSAFLDEVSSWLIRFISPLFAYLKLLSFWGLQLSLLAVLLYVLRALIVKQPSSYNSQEK